MSYDLAAIIAAPNVIAGLKLPESGIVALGPLAMLPITRGVLELHGGNRQHCAGFRCLTPGLEKRLCEGSIDGAIAYVEAWFTSTGSQASLVWDGGKAVLGPLFCDNEGRTAVPPMSQWPINQVLRHLGVVAVAPRDEFETIGLGKIRHTDRWLVTNERARRAG